MSLSRAASWETPGGASRVLARDVLGHCPCCSDRVLAAVAVAAAVLVLVVALAVAVVAVAVAVSSSCMAAERASTLSAAESMAVCVERGGGGSCYLALGRCRVSSHISPAISSTASYINCTFFISPSPSPQPPACPPDSPSPSPSASVPAPRCGSTPRTPLPLPLPLPPTHPASSSDVRPPVSSSASPYNSQTATKVYVFNPLLYALYYTYSLYYIILYYTSHTP